MPDSTDQASESTPSEEYLSQAASYPARTGSFSKNVLCSSGEGQLCTARAALARREASASGTCLTMSSNSASIQEKERVGKQPLRMVCQSLASPGQPANKLKPRHEPEALTSSTQTWRAKGLADPGHTPKRKNSCPQAPSPQAAGVRQGQETQSCEPRETRTRLPSPGRGPRHSPARS